jgi:hypothetical protein
MEEDSKLVPRDSLVNASRSGITPKLAKKSR